MGSRENVLLGENYSLICVIMGADKLSPMISYEWIQNDNLQETIDNVLSFSPFRLSHAGNYSCSVTITSNYVKDMIIMKSNIESLLVQSKFSVSFTKE